MKKLTTSALAILAPLFYVFVAGVTYGYVYQDYMAFYADEPLAVAQIYAERHAKVDAVAWPVYWTAHVGYQTSELWGRRS